MLPSIAPQTLADQLASATPPFVIDVRRDVARTNNPQTIAQAPWYNPALWLDWKDQIGTANALWWSTAPTAMKSARACVPPCGHWG